VIPSIPDSTACIRNRANARLRKSQARVSFREFPVAHRRWHGSCTVLLRNLQRTIAKELMMNSKTLVALVVAGMTLGFAPVFQSCKSNQPVTEQVSDATITSKVKAKYVGDSDVKVFDISVNTEEGVVYLTGRVDTQSQKDEAERIAWNTDGVKQVVNHIKVGSQS
jgi:hypothetical protein